MTQKPSPDLTDLTLEAFHTLEADGRIHQISLPLTVRVPFGPAGDIKSVVESAAVSHGANAYMMGDALQTEAGLVVPVILYTFASQPVAHAAKTEQGSYPQSSEPCVYTEPYVLRNIRCVGSDGNVFEEYAELRVNADVVRQGTAPNSPHRRFTPYQAIVHIESQQGGQFVPSMALSCNILIALFRAAVRREAGGTYTTLDEHAKQILDQYRDYGSGYGRHAQNTFVRWLNPGFFITTKSEIIHYPTNDDFPRYGGTTKINTHRRKIIKKFDREELEGEEYFILKEFTLEELCQKQGSTSFLQDFTGLQNPAELGDVEEYYGRTAQVRIAFKSGTQAAWLGCNDIGGDFSLSADVYLGDCLAARGVASVRAP